MSYHLTKDKQERFSSTILSILAPPPAGPHLASERNLIEMLELLDGAIVAEARHCIDLLEAEGYIKAIDVKHEKAKATQLRFLHVVTDDPVVGERFTVDANGEIWIKSYVNVAFCMWRPSNGNTSG